MPEVLVSIAYEGLAVMTIYFGLFLWYFDEAVLPKVWFWQVDDRCGCPLPSACVAPVGCRGPVGHAVQAPLHSAVPIKAHGGRGRDARPLPRRARLEQWPTAWVSKWIVVRGLRSSRLL